MLCHVTVQSRQMQLQMPCFVSLREKPLGPHVFEPCSDVSEPRSHVSKPRSHVSEPHSHVFRALRLQASHFRLHTFWSSLSGFYSFKPHPLSLTLTLSGLILSALYTSSTLILLHQILVCGTFVLCPVLATSVVRRISKRAKRRAYKEKAGGIRLRLEDYKKEDN